MAEEKPDNVCREALEHALGRLYFADQSFCDQAVVRFTESLFGWGKKLGEKS